MLRRARLLYGLPRLTYRRKIPFTLACAARYPQRRMLSSSAGKGSGHEELIGRRIALISMTVGAAIAVSKIIVGAHVGSAAVTSDGLEAGGDVLSSGIVYTGLWLAAKPPDNEHPYGHGRYETLAGLGVGAILLLAGAAIFWHGFSSFSEPSPLPTYALYPLLASVFIKMALAVSKFRVARRISSTSLQADAWHDITDLLSTFVALVAVGLTLINPVRFVAADHIGGILIGIIIFSLSVQVVRRTVDNLLDTMPDPAKLAEIRRAALSVPGALGIEKCFARPTGLHYHVDLHLEVDPDLTVRDSHDIATRVRSAIKDALPWVADVLVHVEPAPAIVTSKTSHGK
jgi:cation diffusion facilitator family transporter